MKPLVIAIDGPSGSGKSTLARRLARAYGLAYLDTGATFRAATLWAQRQGLDLTDQPAVTAAVTRCPVTMRLDPDDPRVLLSDLDVTDLLHSRELSAVVSHVAVNLPVRAVLAQLQRELIAGELADGWSGGRGIVVEGRDITTVIAPEADVRILLIARPEERLERRTRQRHGVADELSKAATADEVFRRDEQDATVSEFMAAADGVVTLDNSGLAPDETFAAAVRIVARATGLLPGDGPA